MSHSGSCGYGLGEGKAVSSKMRETAPFLCSCLTPLFSISNVPRPLFIITDLETLPVFSRENTFGLNYKCFKVCRNNGQILSVNDCFPLKRSKHRSVLQLRRSTAAFFLDGTEPQRGPADAVRLLP